MLPVPGDIFPKRFCMLIPSALISQASGCRAAKFPAGVTSAALIRGDKSHPPQAPLAVAGSPQSPLQPAPRWRLLPSLGGWCSHPVRMVPGSRWAGTTSPQMGSPQTPGNREWFQHPDLGESVPFTVQLSLWSKTGHMGDGQGSYPRDQPEIQVALCSKAQRAEEHLLSPMVISEVTFALPMTSDGHKYILLLREPLGLLTMSAEASFWQLGMAGVNHRLCHQSNHQSNLSAEDYKQVIHTSLVDAPAPWEIQQWQKTQAYELLCSAAKVLEYSQILGSWYFDWCCCHILRDNS